MARTKTPRIGRFILLRRLGKGSQGAVYQGRDPDLDRLVAIKVLNPTWREFARTDAAERFPTEARAAARLTHPNIVPIYEVGEIRGMPYLVFEHVEGETLRAVMDRGGRLALERVFTILGPVLAAIGHAHERGVLHLDLSPGNILVDRHDVPRVMDFGLARLADAPMVQSRAPVGTLRYMAPEHFANVALGPYTDVYALAQILYEVLVGRPALTAVTTHEAIRQVIRSRWDLGPVASDPQRGVLAPLLETALARNPTRRYADAGAMKEAFDRIATAVRQRDADGETLVAGQDTLQFLLRRMQRRQDFPALSRSLADINRLTSIESRASANDLANVILRDYALTNKLLKLANSAFYGQVRGEVTNISQAVRVLGFQQVRLAANNLTYFSHLQKRLGTVELRDVLIRSFLSGLLARHLAQRLSLAAVEEAFIAGMLQRVGEHLTLYYFAEEHEAICEMVRERGLDKRAAARAVLGIAFEELGAGVARAWRFPEELVHVVAGLPAGEVTPPETETDRLRDVAVFSNELCDVVPDHAPGDRAEAVHALLERFAPSFRLDEGLVPRLLRSGLEKLQRYGAIYGLQLQESPFCHALAKWIGVAPAEEGDAPPEAPAPAPRRAALR